MIEKIKNICLFIATAGGLGGLPLGSIISSFLAIPLLGLLKLCFYMSPIACWWIIMFLGGLILFSLFVSIHMTTTIEVDDVVTDKIMGLMLALAAHPLKVRAVVVALIGFHLVRLYIPYLFRKLPVSLLGNTDHFTGMVFCSGLSGIIINLVLHLMFWVAG